METHPEYSTFGKWLKRHRRLFDLTQEQLGRLAGCSEATIRKIEADERKPSRELAESLVKVLKVPEEQRANILMLARNVQPIHQSFLHTSSTTPALDNLPSPLTSFVNRANDIANIVSLLADDDIRWVTLLGSPGIGKTRLSIQCGRKLVTNFLDGVWFVNLSEIKQPDFVIPLLCRTLTPFNLSPSASLDQISTTLKNRSLLLILDNFEHVSWGALSIATLLSRCPRIKVLATSRIPLHVNGEHEYRVPSLSIPPEEAAIDLQSVKNYEAVQLFIARTRQHHPHFEITSQSAPAVIRICRTFEGIPLALELAAATLHHMSLFEMESLVRHIKRDNWITQFESPMIDLPARQRTLENAISWSYTLLDSEQRDLFKKLAIFSGWFDAKTIAKICLNTPDEVLARKLLNSLEEHSLLERGEIEGEYCWRMLEIIHEYANLQLDQNERAKLSRLLANYTLEQLSELPPKEKETFTQIHIKSLHKTLTRIINEQDAELGLRLAAGLNDFWSTHGYFREGFDFMRKLLSLPNASPPEIRANYLQMAADLAWQMHDFDSALELAHQAKELGQMYGLQSLYLTFINRQGRIYIEKGELSLARQILTECLALARANPHFLNPGMPLAQLGEVALFVSKLDEAKSHLEEALTLLPPNDIIFTAMSMTDLAEIALAKKDGNTAKQWLMRAQYPASQHIRRTLVWLCAVAGFLVLQEERHNFIKAAQIYGAIEALSARLGVPFNPFYQNLNLQRMAIAQQKINAHQWRMEYEAGTSWSRDTALMQAEQALVASDKGIA